MVIERRNFPKKIVDDVLEENDYCCMKCGSYLSQGYHKDHSDGDATNISKENLAVLCPRCHRLRQGQTEYQQLLQSREEDFNQKLRLGIEKYEDAISKGLAGELSGSALKEIMSGIDQFIKQSWRLYTPVDMPTPLPPEISKLVDLDALENERRVYLEGFKDGVRSVRRILNE